MWQELIIGSAEEAGYVVENGITLYKNGKVGRGITVGSPIKSTSGSPSAALDYNRNGTTCIMVSTLSGTNPYVWMPFTITDGQFIQNTTTMYFHVFDVSNPSSANYLPCGWVSSVLPSTLGYPSGTDYVELPYIPAGSSSTYPSMAKGWYILQYTNTSYKTPLYFGVAVRGPGWKMYVDYIGYLPNH